MYFLRTSTKRTLGEETFQREIMAGLVNASLNENLLWNIERTVSNVFIPLLNTNCMGDRGSDQLLYKVKKELLPCLRSFTRSVVATTGLTLNTLAIVFSSLNMSNV